MMNALCLFVGLSIIIGCNSKQADSHKQHEEHTSTNDWPEMDSFHMIMAETFHPYKDSSNLEPLKTNIEELKNEADKWASAPLPEKVNNDEMKKQVQQLEIDVEGLTELIKKGSDEEIAKSLVALHNRFHEIQEGWYKGEEKNESHH